MKQVETSKMKRLLENYLSGFAGSDKPVDFSTITDINQLISYWKGTPSGLESEKLIEARMTELVREVSLDNIPEWFEKALKDPGIIPRFLEAVFTKKAEELLKTI